MIGNNAMHSNLTMSRHIDVAFHILMKSYNQSYNIVYIHVAVLLPHARNPSSLVRGGSKNNESDLRILRLQFKWTNNPFFPHPEVPICLVPRSVCSLIMKC